MSVRQVKWIGRFQIAVRLYNSTIKILKFINKKISIQYEFPEIETMSLRIQVCNNYIYSYKEHGISEPHEIELYNLNSKNYSKQDSI